MGNFNRGRQGGGGFNRSNGRGGSSGYGGRSGGRGFGGQRNSRPQMHQAFCAECGNRCEVPFKPTGEKPVYCSNCFGNSPNYGSKRGGNSRFDRGNRDRGPQMHAAVCAECGVDCEVPFKPTGEKPVLCSQCFGGGKPQRSTSRSDDRMSSPEQNDTSAELESLQKEVAELSKKLDKVLMLLQRSTPVKEVTVMKVAKEEATEASLEKEEKPEEKPTVKATKKVSKKTVAKKKAAPKAKATKKAAAKKKAVPKKTSAKKVTTKKKVTKKK